MASYYLLPSTPVPLLNDQRHSRLTRGLQALCQEQTVWWSSSATLGPVAKVLGGLGSWKHPIRLHARHGLASSGLRFVLVLSTGVATIVRLGCAGPHIGGRNERKEGVE